MATSFYNTSIITTEEHKSIDYFFSKQTIYVILKKKEALYEVKTDEICDHVNAYVFACFLNNYRYIKRTLLKEILLSLIYL